MNRISTTQTSENDVGHFFDLASDLMCVLDDRGCCTQVNQAFVQTMGYSALALRDRALSSLAHPDDRASIQAHLNRLAREANISFTHRFVAKSTQVYWLEWKVSSVEVSTSSQRCRRLYGVAKDVTHLYQLQSQLAQQKDALLSASSRYTALAQVERQSSLRASVAETQRQLYTIATRNMQVGLYVWRLENLEDPRSLRLIAANPATEDFTGVPAEHILNKPILEAFPALAKTDIPAQYADVVRTNQSCNLGEVTYGDDRVEKSIFTVKAFPLTDSCMGIVFENITERKATEQTLERQKNTLAKANLMLTHTMQTLEQRNEELDQFAYVASHDLKAPLRAIANLATWIEEDLEGQLPAENVEQLDLLKSRVHRMEGLINGLLEYSRVGRTHQSSEQVDVAELLAEILDSLPTDDFTIAIAPNMPTFQAKRTPLSQVFSNLIDNAIKHHDRRDGTVEIGMSDLGLAYQFTIKDDGPGIAPAFHEKVFTIFQTLRARDDLESTGIGLSLVRKIILAEGGQIQLLSEEGEGATFQFTWPKTPFIGEKYAI